MGALQEVAKEIVPLFRLLGSNHPGEVSAAVAGIKRKLGASGLDLNDLANWIESAAQGSAADSRHSSGQKKQRAKSKRRADHRAASHESHSGAPLTAEQWEGRLQTLWMRGEFSLSARDMQFLTNVWSSAQRGRSPSPAQAKWIGDIEAKLDLREAKAS